MKKHFCDVCGKEYDPSEWEQAKYSRAPMVGRSTCLAYTLMNFAEICFNCYPKLTTVLSSFVEDSKIEDVTYDPA